METGNSGVSFKCARRYRSKEEAQKQLKHFHILEQGGKMVGGVKTMMKENGRIVNIGPVAVHPDHQVSFYSEFLKSNLLIF